MARSVLLLNGSGSGSLTVAPALKSFSVGNPVMLCAEHVSVLVVLAQSSALMRDHCDHALTDDANARNGLAKCWQWPHHDA